jgi:predicted nucleic acid-binding protein
MGLWWDCDYLVDTSALVKRHVNETGSKWVRSLTRPNTPAPLFIGHITAVEVFSAITRRQRGGILSSAQAAAILGHFRRHLTQRYNVLELTPSLITAAMSMARTHGLRAYDAVQLTAALEVNRQRQAFGLQAVTLVSADQELNAAAWAEGLTVEDPNSHT